MTEKEFENLKVGDKVWKVSNWYEHDYKAYQFEVVSINYVGKHIIAIGEFGSTTCLPYSNCYLHCSEAWGNIVEFYEEKIKDEEADIVVDKKALDRYKSELAKAKEEEEKEQKVWTVDFEEGSVICSTKWRWEGSAENYEWSLGSPRYKPCETKDEAYEALAKFYERKLFKALEKCGYKFAICCDKNIAAVKINEDSGKFYWGYCYPHLSYGSICKANVFDTLDEAEAELERRKRND